MRFEVEGWGLLWGLGFGAWGLGFSGSRFGFSGLGFKGSEYRVQGKGLVVNGLRIVRIQGLGLRVPSSGFRV